VHYLFILYLSYIFMGWIYSNHNRVIKIELDRKLAQYSKPLYLQKRGCPKGLVRAAASSISLPKDRKRKKWRGHFLIAFSLSNLYNAVIRVKSVSILNLYDLQETKGNESDRSGCSRCQERREPTHVF